MQQCSLGAWERESESGRRQPPPPIADDDDDDELALALHTLLLSLDQKALSLC